MHKLALPVLLASSLALAGCAASIAAGMAGAALRSAQSDKQVTGDVAPAAVQACEARASQHGLVRIIDVERRSVGKVVVWGTSGEGAERRSFECGYKGKISRFKVRTIQAQ
jgi:hypothetical protein